ncbi:MAG: EscS/YscS/HrcS family type III secretion system export apparatus protein [Gammaproteobacteria bacterium]|nr:MAG: EscS/YscS/HrcS family type III secretion system export apparatus protein [Pseudomonadota bacterium]PIE38876.1 MAG: EscS/YscS/HrcS family type III secretion system export apparatus protein [Gammaproteobacteria bacterium]
MDFDVVRQTQEALWLMLVLSAPTILAASVSGLIVAIIQAVTQLQEQTVSFAVKLFAVGVTLFLTAGLMGESLFRFGHGAFTGFPAMVR